MSLKSIKLESTEETINKLREVKLRGFNNYPIYKQASLSLYRQVHPEEIIPAQNYIITETLDSISRMYHNVRDVFNIDLFSLNGAAIIDTGEEEIPFLPPVVEVSKEDGNILLLNDGMHRVALALLLNKKINIIVVSDFVYPYYALPNPKSWGGVRQIKQIDREWKGFKGKEYRYPENYKDYFRDFNSVYSGVQKQR